MTVPPDIAAEVMGWLRKADHHVRNAEFVLTMPARWRDPASQLTPC